MQGFDCATNKNRPAILTASESSNWLSCQSITPAIVEACKIAFGRNLDFFSYRDKMSEWELQVLAQKILEAQPSRLIFTDHRPHPLPFLRELAKLSKGPLPACTFHIYGDFTLFTREWCELDPLLKGMPADFLCASTRQASLLKRFLTRDNIVHVCPFPVDSSLYNFAPETRARARARLGLRDGEFAVVYAGRHSLQKNVTWLLEEFGTLAAAHKKARLLLAGPFCELGAPFFIRRASPSYFAHYHSALTKLPKSIQSRVTYLGTLEGETLRDLYLAGDAYASLSLHHDEDFGMAPAQALCCGSPAVLTNWGGFAYFNQLSPFDVDLVPAKMSKRGLVVKRHAMARNLERIMRRAEGAEHRARRSERFQEFLSIQSTAATIAKLGARLPRPFRGFNDLLTAHAELAETAPMFLNDSQNVYRQVYGAYLESGDGVFYSETKRAAAQSELLG